MMFLHGATPSISSAEVLIGDCKSGWFGEHCQYQCHCTTGCTDDGMCLKDSCSLGWFGELCQYLMTINASVTFTTSDKKKEECKTLSSKRVLNPNLTDYHCEPSSSVTHITVHLQLLQKMCSLYVSGGRNLAFGQNAQQTSTHTIFFAWRAIDGVKSPIHIMHNCSHTSAFDQTPYFNLTYNVPVVLNRIFLYNRAEGVSERLNGFILHLYNEYKNLIFEYKDTTVEKDKLVYTVLLPVMEPVWLIVIYATHILRADVPIVTICEIETFGDCPNYLWGLQCDVGCDESCFQGCSLLKGICNYILADSDCSSMSSARCAVGWFGPNCRYKCHCTDGCDRQGNCLGSTCETGWFGHLCQYKNLVNRDFSEVTSDEVSVDQVIDGVDETCVMLTEMKTHISVQFNHPIVFTFLRLHTDKANILNASMKLELSDKRSVSCDNNNKALIVNVNNLDIYCHLNDSVVGITITLDPINLCSMYVSGGRNLAYGQQVAQSSNSSSTTIKSFGFAQKAVDGHVDLKLYRHGCSHTDYFDVNAHFNLTFGTLPVIQRILLFNRDDIKCKRRLDHFTLTLLDSQNRIIQRYQDKTNYSNLIYTVLFPEQHLPVWRVSVCATSVSCGDKYPILCVSWRRMEVNTRYCVPGTWGLDCDKACPTSCNTSCSTMDGTCLWTCMYGRVLPDCWPALCPNGMYGMDCSFRCSEECYNKTCSVQNGECFSDCMDNRDSNCTTKCSSPRYGVNCSMICSASCWNRVCDDINGTCKQGCNGYSNPPNCDIDCEKSMYGANCSMTCSKSCWNGVCYDHNGSCILGCHGYSNPPICDKVCTDGTYGRNCENFCSQCVSYKCNHVTGQCEYGCQGFEDFPVCSKECPHGKYGVNCSLNCSTHCYKGLCNLISGSCDYGCDNFLDPPECLIHHWNMPSIIARTVDSSKSVWIPIMYIAFAFTQTVIGFCIVLERLIKTDRFTGDLDSFESVTSQPYPSHIPVLSQSHPSLITVTSQFYPSLNPGTSKSYPSLNLVISQSYPRHISVLSQSHQSLKLVTLQSLPSHIPVLTKSHPSLIPVTLQSLPSHISVLNQSHPVLTQSHPSLYPVTLQSYPSQISVLT
ncbi:hypothetical protein Btru_019958 [Bulinus truncatus]|nr:hypothetical protein Btru_019958 [Bulinus truncatus]